MLHFQSDLKVQNDNLSKSRFWSQGVFQGGVKSDLRSRGSVKTLITSLVWYVGCSPVVENCAIYCLKRGIALPESY